MEYEIILKPSAQRDLDALPMKEVHRVAERISNLSSNPRPFGVQKLSAQEGYRIRIGRYRVLYDIDDHARRILIYRVKHRKEVYR